MTKKESQNIETIAIHAGMEHGSKARSISPPMEPSTNFEHDERGYQEGDYIYTRDSNPNRDQLENVLTKLEKGEGCVAFSSGIAAMNAVFMNVRKGSHILIPEDLYHGSRALLEKFGERWSVEYSSVDTTNLEKFEAAFRSNTKLVILETPSNPLLLITDLKKSIQIAKSKGAKVCVDNTFATPFNTNPIEFGADLVMHSTSKYLGGHSDILGGAIVSAKTDEFFQQIKTIQKSQGAVPSPRDCWLLTRSIRSFPYRMRAHNENARQIAKFLKAHSRVIQVNYPGLKSSAGHEIAASQMKGFGGMISFLIDGDYDETLKIVAGSKVIRRATSLGGIESLWEHRLSSESESSITPENLIRFSVGLEHIDDLIHDLKGALGK
ncbi:MAG: aminotransferase class V-fold PLP-dependent enzyme [Balneolaceae bacterium]|nr:aminotransferase class V-fold PLP-dependent enzyme [Balneolaceae bacterium]MBO6545315.1 aminotransferase class V-fold PLP-dependent enzyme [Balneolaceae bacterium]MBO6646711.1 aminotransferase class V-fold PLP-dependent enzyme [Balneolaceae bacterium]